VLQIAVYKGREAELKEQLTALQSELTETKSVTEKQWNLLEATHLHLKHVAGGQGPEATKAPVLEKRNSAVLDTAIKNELWRITYENQELRSEVKKLAEGKKRLEVDFQRVRKTLFFE